METAEISNRDKRVEIVLSGLIITCLVLRFVSSPLLIHL